MIYPALKHLHLTCVALSGLGFALRGFWMLTDSPQLGLRWVRIFPHIVDSLLLGSAVALAVVTRQYPFVDGWLTAKLAGLLVYILCGTMALKRGKTKAARAMFLVAALMTLVWIIVVAITKTPTVFPLHGFA